MVAAAACEEQGLVWSTWETSVVDEECSSAGPKHGDDVDPAAPRVETLEWHRDDAGDECKKA